MPVGVQKFRVWCEEWEEGLQEERGSRTLLEVGRAKILFQASV